jgi:hypothetical protein
VLFAVFPLFLFSLFSFLALQSLPLVLSFFLSFSFLGSTTRVPKLGESSDTLLQHSLHPNDEKIVDLKLSGMLDLASEISNSLESIVSLSNSTLLNSGGFLALSTDGGGLETGAVIKAESTSRKPLPPSSSSFSSSSTSVSSSSSSVPSAPSKERKRRGASTSDASSNKPATKRAKGIPSPSPGPTSTLTTSSTSKTAASSRAQTIAPSAITPQPSTTTGGIQTYTTTQQQPQPQSVEESERKVGRLLDENANLINFIREHLMNGKMKENAEPMARFQRNVFTVLQM